MGSGMKYTVNVKNPEDDFYTPEVEQAIKDYLNRIDLCMQQWGEGANDYSEETGLFKYVDMESLVAYFIGNEISGNYDGLISNYAYRDINPDDKLKFGPLWDFDIAYGNYGDLEEAFIFDAGKNNSWAYLGIAIKKVIENSPKFTSLLVKRWNQVYDNGSLTTFLHDKMSEIANSMTGSRTLNYTPVANGGAGWKTTEDMLGWGTKTYSDYGSAIRAMKSFISKHIEFLNTKINEMKTEEEEETVTGIVTVGQPSVAPDEWFTLDGRLLSGKPQQRGIYVNAGRKVVVK